ncbi:MAG: hypothetical protein ACKV0T_10480 [Planctomycetales bacterium]
MPRRLILRSFQSPGDVTVLTAAVRDLHLAHPGQFVTDVRTSADALWQNNPFITRLNEGEPGVEQVEMHYPLIHESNQRPYHFLHDYVQYLERHLGLRIPRIQSTPEFHKPSVQFAPIRVAGEMFSPELIEEEFSPRPTGHPRAAPIAPP